MGNNRPVKTSYFIKFLKSLNCKEKPKDNGGSHFHYKCPNCFRTITIRSTEKEIPPTHIRSNLKTLGINITDMYDWIESNC